MEQNKENTSSVSRTLKEYFIITVAVLIMDIGIYVFKFPNNCKISSLYCLCNQPGHQPGSFGGRFRFSWKKLRTENSLRHRSLFGTIKCF